MDCPSVPVKLSPDFAVLVEIDEVVQTEIGVPAASVKTLGGAGGGAGADEVGEEGFRPGARPPVEPDPGFDPPPDDIEVPVELATPAFPAASVGEGTTLGSTVGVGEALAKLEDSVELDLHPV